MPPQNKPRKEEISKRYAREIRAQLGKGTTVEVINSHTLVPRGWDFANSTQLMVTTRKREVPITIRLNVAPGDQASGNATIDVPGWDGTIAVAGANTEEAISAIVAQLAGYLRSL